MPVVREDTAMSPAQYKLRPRKSKSLAEVSSGSEPEQEVASGSDAEVEVSRASSDEETLVVRSIKPSRLDPIMAGSARSGHGHETGSPEFSRIYHQVHVYDKNKNPAQISFEASLSRGFFRARGDWTCYRRNYITVSAQLDDIPKPIFLHNGQVLSNFGLKLSGCTCSDPPAPVDLIQHTAKRDKGPQDQPEFRPIDSVGFQTLWDRIQFRTATANNGKKQEQQQYFSLRVSLMAYVTGEGLPSAWIEVASRYSDPLVVRGRSPGHYNDPGERSSASSSASPVLRQRLNPVRPAPSGRPQQAIAPRPVQMLQQQYASSPPLSEVRPVIRSPPHAAPYPAKRHSYTTYTQGARTAPERYPRSTPQDYVRPVEQPVALPVPAPLPLQLPPLRLDLANQRGGEASRLPTYDEIVQNSVSSMSGSERSTPGRLPSIARELSAPGALSQTSSISPMSPPISLPATLLSAGPMAVPVGSVLQGSPDLEPSNQGLHMLAQCSTAETHQAARLETKI